MAFINKMKFARYLKKELIFLKMPYRTKGEVIKYLTRELCKFYKFSCEKEIVDNIIEREKIKSTGLTLGLAVPHGRVELVDKLYVVFGRSARGIEWDSSDKKPAHYIFLVVGPNKLAREYLEMLGQISRVMMRHTVREVVKHAKEPEEVIQVIKASGIRHHKR